MKLYPIVAMLSGIACTLSIASDVFVMKDGSTIEGSILREDSTTYVLEVHVTKSIRDERVIAKADVEKIKRELPEQIAFKQIEKLTPTLDLQTTDEYGRRIRAVEKFLTDYRLSSKSNDAKEILATLKSEVNEILAGGIKLNDKIIPATEYKANAYDIDARIQEKKIRRLIADFQSLQALRAFSVFERDFRNTSAYIALVPQIYQLLAAYSADAAQLLGTLDARVKDRNLGLLRMPVADRRITENAIREEAAELEVRFKTEKDTRIPWVTVHPFCRLALEDTVNSSKQELTRLATVKNTPLQDAGKGYRDLITLIQNKAAPAEITSAITALRAAMVPERYLATLETSLPPGETDS